ncbi:hypothetical protein QE357_000359 [Siphonobacter sp. BAB-5404]|nr:hypothetical protein [Siphonobacter sp. SORGH_AS_0500]
MDDEIIHLFINRIFFGLHLLYIIDLFIIIKELFLSIIFILI